MTPATAPHGANSASAFSAGVGHPQSREVQGRVALVGDVAERCRHDRSRGRGHVPGSDGVNEHDRSLPLAERGWSVHSPVSWSPPTVGGGRHSRLNRSARLSAYMPVPAPDAPLTSFVAMSLPSRPALGAVLVTVAFPAGADPPTFAARPSCTRMSFDCSARTRRR